MAPYVSKSDIVSQTPHVSQPKANISSAVQRDAGADMGSQDTWARMLGQTKEQLSGRPAPYTWNAILAYAASQGWGLQQDLTQAQYVAGQALLRYTTALINVPFVREGPIKLPNWMLLPAFITALGTT